MSHESERFEMRISLELLARIDDWAKAQPDTPARAAAMKRLIAMALEFENMKARLRAKKQARVISRFRSNLSET